MMRRIGLTPPSPEGAAGSLAEWAASGLMVLTGPHDGAPSLIDHDVAGRVNTLRKWVEALADRPISIPQSYIVGRAAMMGLSRQGGTSCNGQARLLRLCDGWFVLNLARRDDADLLPALFECELEDSGWPTLERMAKDRYAEQMDERAALLGLPAAVVRKRSLAPPIWMTPMECGDRANDTPLVVDLSALWAGPLCGRILSDCGAQVIKVESRGRPDGARDGCPAFFDLLNRSKEEMSLDFGSTVDRAHLGALLRRADIVVESSRPRALERLGLSREAIARDNPGVIWCSITGHGRDGGDASRVGFGDDAAAAAGLLAWQEGSPYFVGDAVADPLAGLMAAGAILSARRTGTGSLIDISLRTSAAWAASGRPIRDIASACVTGNERDGFVVEHAGLRHPVVTPAEILAAG